MYDDGNSPTACNNSSTLLESAKLRIDYWWKSIITDDSNDTLDKKSN
jgi:hypothetical protein